MANTVEMVVKLHEDDRKRLDAILNALQNVNVLPNTDNTLNTTTETEKPAEVPDIVTPNTSPETTEEPTYTVKDVQQKVLELTTQKGVAKASVRDVVKKYADKVQNIPQDKLSAVMQELNKLEG